MEEEKRHPIEMQDCWRLDNPVEYLKKSDGWTRESVMKALSMCDKSYARGRENGYDVGYDVGFDVGYSGRLSDGDGEGADE